MSEAEKKKRQDYIRNRKIWIIVQIVVAAVLAIDLIASLFTYYQLDKTHYVEYTESGATDYYVLIYDDEFYDEDFLEEGQAYVSELVKEIVLDFDYELNMDAQNFVYEYTYKIDAILEIRDRDNNLLLKKNNNLIPKISYTQNSNQRLEIDESISIDYPYYNDFASRYMETYDLQTASASLNVRMDIDVVSDSGNFGKSAENSYFISLNIPLAEQTIKIDTLTSVDSGLSKILAYTNNLNQNVFKVSAIVSAILEMIVVAVLIAFIFKTRNHDINYSIKVRKIVSAYKSYIQRIVNEIDTTNYQLLYVSSFREMLEIRDTIGAPILMNENEDKTRSRFFILTNTSILYIYEIKVENYDEIYGDDSTEKEIEKPIITAADPSVEELSNIQEEPKEAELKPVASNEADIEIPEVQDEPIIEAQPEKSSDEVAPILAYLDNEGNGLDIRYSRSFEANLIQSDDTVKQYYNELKNYIMSFKGVKSRFSWKFETFNKGRNPFFKIKLRGKTILLYCAVDPNAIDKSKYRHEAIDNKLFADVPTLLKIKAGLNVRRAKEIIDLVMSNFQMEKNPKAQEVDYKSQYHYEDNDALIERGLIKVLANGEK